MSILTIHSCGHQAAMMEKSVSILKKSTVDTRHNVSFTSFMMATEDSSLVTVFWRSFSFLQRPSSNGWRRSEGGSSLKAIRMPWETFLRTSGAYQAWLKEAGFPVPWGRGGPKGMAGGALPARLPENRTFQGPRGAGETISGPVSAEVRPMPVLWGLRSWRSAMLTAAETNLGAGPSYLSQQRTHCTS